MLWMYTMMASAWFATSAPPVRVLLLAEPRSAGLQQNLLYHALIQEFLAAPQFHLVTEEPIPPALLRAGRLRRAGLRQLSLARAHMFALHPDDAATLAAMATEKLGRVATLSGDVTPLVDSLALQAAAYLHAGAQRAARRTLVRLLVLRPSWTPDPSLYNPDMQRSVRAARAEARALPSRTVILLTGDAESAVFADGAFVGRGTVEMTLTACQPHYLYAMPPHAEATGTQVVPQPAAAHTETLLRPRDGSADAQAHDAAATALQVRLVALRAGLKSCASARYQSVFAAAAASEGFVEPTLPALAGAHIDRVWVVSTDKAGGDGVVTAFDLQRGRRTVAPAALAAPDLWLAHAAARALVSHADQPRAASPGPE